MFQWDPGDGNDTIEGQDGTDTLLTSTAPTSPRTSTSLPTAGACYSSATSPTSPWTSNDVEGIDFHALGGADNIVINDLSGTDATVAGVDVDLAGGAGGGDGAADRVTVNGTAGNEIITVFANAGIIGVNGASAAGGDLQCRKWRPVDRQRRRRQ